MFNLILGFASTVLIGKEQRPYNKTKSSFLEKDEEFIKNDDNDDNNNINNKNKTVNLIIQNKNKNMDKNGNEVSDRELGVLNVRTVSVLLSGSEGSGLNHLAVGVAQKVRNEDRHVIL